jgi:ATP-dependent DNA helicase RecQ
MVITKVISELSRLNKMGILSYTPKKESPQICYIQDRVRADELEIDHAAYILRKKNYEDRVEAMIHYAKGNDCKSIQIGNYFGDESISSCGKCDNCIKQDEKRSGKMIYDQTLSILKNESLTYAQLKKRLPFAEKEVLNILQFLRDQEKIIMDNEGKIVLK